MSARSGDPTRRRAVLELARRERRRIFPPALHVGVPGGSSAVFEPADEEGLDHTLRVDIVEALVGRVRRPPALVWLTRPGPLDLQDLDLWWLAATTTAAKELGTALTIVVVCRKGWRDPGTGEGREWVKLRR